ncbi:hypothetical protein [Streptomyces sp. H27-C3]|uniref:hypothetical protein n=1 Tax=Streptomyces sp. H27-C3 TaxID=3046305 RepID=UPI0024BA356D|nr:hypothetical protein [Streptomyces sp. H27-C3]MDJ0464941.1 hypothetical protein [Streptomyces sp. H27-C3]
MPAAGAQQIHGRAAGVAAHRVEDDGRPQAALVQERGGERDLALDELLTGRGEGRVLCGEPFDPAGGVQVGNDERVVV